MNSQANENDPSNPPPEGPAQYFTKDYLIFYLVVLKTIFSGVLIPLFDIGTDFATAVTHFLFSNWSWGILTLFFVWLPGFVCALAITIRGLKTRFTFQRCVNYLILLAGFPLLYPLVQILV